MKRTAFVIFAICLSVSSLLAQSSKNYLIPEKCYVVVGVFNYERNAINFDSLATEELGNSTIGYHPIQKLHYVYTGEVFESIKDGIGLYNETRVKPGYDSTWIYKVGPYELPEDTDEKVTAMSEGEETPTIEEGDNSETEVETDVSDKTMEEESVNDEAIAGVSGSGLDVSDRPDLDSDINQIASEEEEAEPLGRKYYFNTIRKDNFKEIETKVEIIDPARVETMGFRDTHKLVYIEDPNASGDMQVICDVFGFKKIQHDFNINDSINEQTESFLEIKGDTLVVDFELRRYTKGDLVSMFNVFFFKDAAILRDESRYQLGQLLDMLEENENYKILISGNTNGNAPGPIISLPEDSNDFFNLDVGKEGVGSAKALSKARAETIKRYLVSKGVDESRIKVKGRGGKDPLYDKYHKMAYRNMRVDIEILADQ